MDNKIAVVGLACRFPGAKNANEFWNNLLNGLDTIKHFTNDELKDFEFDFDSLKSNPSYVRARGVLDDIDKFDSSFFGMTPREAAMTDPQHRLWLETAWDALENAGCAPSNVKGSIGVFAGGALSTYILNNILRDPSKIENFIRFRSSDIYQIMTGNDPSYISTKTAYKFNLRGPAISVQTACSTSLVAISQACQSLYTFESDICIAGGVCINVPQESGYLYQEGGIPSPDGICRPFDSLARGTVPSNGVGAVVLKRLDDALNDNDKIYAVVRGWALNNDGSNKVSYTAPSVDGQSEAIMMAQSFADVSPEEISYIEAHGTATQLGDPIEVAALTKAFFTKTNKKQFCGIGSVKSNIGHTDAAAGVASFIKSCLSAYYKIIPPSINYSEPNPLIDFQNSPFYVQNNIKKWTENNKPLIIGVSSFGIGGTNAHVIIEEPPVISPKTNKPSAWPYLIPLSAKSENSLIQKKQDIQEFIKNNVDLNIRDLAYTLTFGRSYFNYRSFAIASESSSYDLDFSDGKTDETLSSIAFMFPGQGSQYPGMAKSLYNSNQFFQGILNECFDIFYEITKYDIKEIIFKVDDERIKDNHLNNTEVTQPALFIIEYALAKLLLHLEVIPKYLIGHSIGEYVAACISGVFDLPTALKIVVKRGKLMQQMPKGEMLAVRSGKNELDKIRENCFEIAGENSSNSCTISYKLSNRDKVKEILETNSIQYILLDTSHAFHSSDFDPILDEFSNYVNQFNLANPKIPFISCLTGEFITNEQATSANYWAQQLRYPVMFRKGIESISKASNTAFLEVGPNTHLSSLVKQNESVSNKKAVIQTIGKPDKYDELYKVLASIGNLFNLGFEINFQSFYEEYSPTKISLPSYPYDKKRHWNDSLPFGNFYTTNQTDSFDNNQTYADTDTPSSDLNSTQNGLVKIWQNLFGIDKIDINDDFIELGGHSLLALQINNRIKDLFKVELTLKEFLEKGTILKIGELIDSRAAAPDSLENHKNLVTLLRSKEIKTLPLTNNQKRLWLISKLDPDVASYIISDSFKLTGNLNIELFQQSLEKLFNHHHIAFSKFKEFDGEPYCDIVPSKVNLALFDFSNLNEELKKVKILELIESDSKKVFDLENGPLFRLYLIKSLENEFYFHFSIHHIIFDGWSWSVFTNGLCHIYNSLLSGKEATLDPIEFHQYDYAKWEKSSEALKIEERSKHFWKEYLKGSNSIIDFPFDNPRKEKPSGRGNYVNVQICAKTTEKLKEISRREGASLFTTLFSVYGIQMHKYSAQSDINIGLPVAYRPHSKLENILGMFVNTIVVRIRCEKDSTFKEIIKNTNESALNAIDHQDLAFDKIVEIVNPERSPNINPLFQVAFAWQNNLDEPLSLVGIESQKLDKTERATEFDITLSLWEQGNQIEGTFEYNLDILKHDTIIRLRDNFLNLIEKLIQSDTKAIGSIPMITEDEFSLINTFNQTQTNYPKNLTISQLFEDQAKLYPKKLSVVFKEETLSYEELNSKANQLARTLRENGVGRNCAVGIFVDKSVNMIVGILGILKAGGAYVPIDPEYPEQRINFIIKDSGCKIILTQNHYLHLSFEGIKKLNIDSGEIYHCDPSNIECISTPEDLAYIIYTSGTTGIPKGTLIPQKGVVRLVRNTNYIEFKPDDRVLQTSAIVFDASTEEIFGALLNGSILYIIDKQTVLDANAFGHVLNKHQITIVDLSSALFTQIAEIHSGVFKNVEKLILGGDVISAPHVNKVRQENPGLCVINTYGPTENSCNSTGYVINQDFESNIPIGKPISNSTAYIFDNNMHYQPIGIIGELYVGGDGLSKGYLNRDDLNNKCFVFNPYNLNEKLYKTGDRARWLPDGNIEFHGRIDNQIKIRGYRVELEEIESVISNIEGVIETVVKPLKVEEGDYKLIAFLNIKESFSYEINDLARLVKTKLPQYMVPSAFKLMRGFPKNVNGKIDRKALVVELVELEPLERKKTEELTQTEKILIDLCSSALKIRDISPSDNFFEIGGNSLLTISLASKIEKEFGIEFSIRNFFSSPKIKDLAEIVDIKIGLNIQGNDSVKMMEGEI